MISAAFSAQLLQARVNDVGYPPQHFPYSQKPPHSDIRFTIRSIHTSPVTLRVPILAQQHTEYETLVRSLLEVEPVASQEWAIAEQLEDVEFDHYAVKSPGTMIQLCSPRRSKKFSRRRWRLLQIIRELSSKIESKEKEHK